MQKDEHNEYWVWWCAKKREWHSMHITTMVRVELVHTKPSWLTGKSWLRHSCWAAMRLPAHHCHHMNVLPLKRTNVYVHAVTTVVDGNLCLCRFRKLVGCRVDTVATSGPAIVRAKNRTTSFATVNIVVVTVSQRHSRCIETRQTRVYSVHFCRVVLLRWWWCSEDQTMPPEPEGQDCFHY